MDLFEKIKALRIERKLSQKEMADFLGISQAAYAKIERPVDRDTKKISIEYGKIIAKALGISFNELFEIENFENSDFEKLKLENEHLKKRITELSEQLQDKKTIIEFLSKNDFTLDIAAKIWHLEIMNTPGLAAKVYEANQKHMRGIFNEDPETKTPYDPGDKQSQIKYIERWFEQIEKREK